MKFLVVIVAMLSCASAASGRERPMVFVLTTHEMSAPGDVDDPAYQAYRAGYELILNEQWQDARQQLEELVKRYPRSEYLDDARYWLAYALRFLDRKNAIVEYRRFITEFPQSSYYDDAVADLEQLQAGSIWVTTPQARVAIRRLPEGAAPKAMVVAPKLRSMQRELRLARQRLGAIRFDDMQGRAFAFGYGANLDPDTEVRIEAMYALGHRTLEAGEYRTLLTIALDRTQPKAVREAALDILSENTTHNILPVLVDIAKNDTAAELRSYAIDLIGSRATDKNASADALIEIFRAIPPDRKEPQDAIFYAIAEIGNDTSVEFLRNIAMNDKNRELRREAVYYLGSIGGEKARAALYEILKGNK